ncbi:restriction endonuclease subunit S [Streptomyces sp. NBC_00986]|uniref:restriction endonuclease subunit S n=1 Tax=Streptomyces sp. NBC_00986 TaxID=2903702 RepID=UPI00386C82C5|nr:restriction endonuclease subunit S [Streptomyces sp. NBC_00986]
MRDREYPWPEVCLREIGEISAGGTPSRDDPSLWNGAIPWLTPGDLTKNPQTVTTESAEYITRAGLNRSAAALMPAGALLVTTRATLGARTIAGVPMATNQGFKNISFNSNLAESRFYFHLFRRLTSELVRRASGTTFLEISGKEFGEITVPLPPLSEQRHIVEILDAVDMRIDLASAEHDKAKACAEALAQSLIPIDPNPQDLGDGWDLLALSEVIPSVEYGISSPLELGMDGIPTLRMNNLEGGKMRLHEVKVSVEAVPPDLLLRDRDVLFNRTNSLEHVGRTSLWRSEIPVATFASYLVRLNPDHRRLCPEYLVRWLNRPAVQQRIRRFATPGVHQVNINPTSLRRTLIELPIDVRRQQQIVAELDAIDAVVSSLQSEHRRLLEFKQGLMEDLLSGRVRV